MNEDLARMSREQLIDELRKLRRGIRTHRDSTGHELCWHHPTLWGLLPEKRPLSDSAGASGLPVSEVRLAHRE